MQTFAVLLGQVALVAHAVELQSLGYNNYPQYY
jgi:hypothetical protein